MNLIDTNPKVSDNALVSNGNFKNVEVGIVPVEYWIFYEKVQVEVEQISLSAPAFNYWKTVADQKQGAASLFQPAIGKAVTNMRLVSGTQEAQGLFSAAASTKKYIFLDASNIPIGADFIPSAPPPIPESCLSTFPFSTTVKPATW